MHVLLARHGETPWNRDGRYQGHTDVALSETGEAQAASLGKRLASVTIHQALASPLVRARRTAELALGSSRAALLRTDDGLKEISHGQWEGKLVTEIEQSHPELLKQWKHAPTATLPAGPRAESLQQVLDRAWPPFAAAVKRLEPNQTLLVVAHDAVNRAILCRVLGLPLERVWSFRQAPATLNVLAGPSLEQLQVVRLNDAEHVAPWHAEAVHVAV
ncbi:MAG: histidine phosphatase family protein [Archangium sp.]|nr:histidine phosphatase family protein [Archangium sp.]